jgi:hypothetical protein
MLCRKSIGKIAEGVKAAFVRALRAAQQRAAELGREN